MQKCYGHDVCFGGIEQTEDAGPNPTKIARLTGQNSRSRQRIQRLSCTLKLFKFKMSAFGPGPAQAKRC